MKKALAAAFISFCLLPVALGQVRTVKAYCQKTTGSLEGVFMKYTLEFSDKKNTSAEIDSVKSMADASSLTFYFHTHEPRCKEVTFQVTLLSPAKCKTCAGTATVQANLTKGVVMYYHTAGKKYVCKVKNFKRLEDKLIP